MPVRLTAGTSPTTAPSRWAVVSTYQPTRCGIATFARSLVGALSDLGTDVDVVRIVDVTEPRSAPPVAYELVRGDLDSVDTAAQVLNGYDVAVIQHEYGIYGGQDGADLLALLSRLTVPVLTVLHTVLSEPTAHQRHVLQSVVSASDAVVTMTQTARRRLLDTVVVDPEHVQVIPHGAAQDLVSHAGHRMTGPRVPTARRAGPSS